MLVWLERHRYAAFFILLGAALVFAGLYVQELRNGGPRSLVLHAASSPDAPAVVHVAGAVAAPGVYELPPGSRLQDALQAAGGASPDADLDELNLARPLRDGEQVKVPGAARPLALTSPPLDPTLPLDLNTATAAELDTLPGIGEAYARRIVDSRIVDGPFASVDDLLVRNVLPAATLNGIRSHVTVSPP